MNAMFRRRVDGESVVISQGRGDRLGGRYPGGASTLWDGICTDEIGGDVASPQLTLLRNSKLHQEMNVGSDGQK